MGQYRLVRLGEQLKSEISNMIIRHEIKDPRVNEFLTIHRVDVAGDLAYAKVYVSSFMDENSVKRGVQGLQSAAGFIQSSIAKKLTIYKFPKLTFIADSSIKDGYEMVQKLNALEKEESALAPESPAESSAQSSDEEE
ncbi:MAG: 30S ribosome-binding factor RbfA [Treponema sp.]|nr:30S ribosome-binding factor RbfA [Treponema sp.]